MSERREARFAETAKLLTEAVEAANEFEAFHKRLTRRLDRERRAPTTVEYRKLRSLWEAWERTQRAWEPRRIYRPSPDSVHVQVVLRPPPWEEFEDEFGPVPEPEAAEPVLAPEVVSGASLPLTLVEKALRQHVRDNCGRRTLAQIPGLTEWTAGQILRWYRRGEPDGLWFDEQDRLQVGASLAPTPDGVRLPRI